jgi:hypothetical protein
VPGEVWLQMRVGEPYVLAGQAPTTAVAEAAEVR